MHFRTQLALDPSFACSAPHLASLTQPARRAVFSVRLIWEEQAARRTTARTANFFMRALCATALARVRESLLELRAVIRRHRLDRALERRQRLGARAFRGE